MKHCTALIKTCLYNQTCTVTLLVHCHLLGVPPWPSVVHQISSWLLQLARGIHSCCTCWQGSTTGYIRFITPEQATAGLALADDGKLSICECSAVVKLLEGQEEEEYFKKVKASSHFGSHQCESRSEGISVSRQPFIALTKHILTSCANGSCPITNCNKQNVYLQSLNDQVGFVMHCYWLSLAVVLQANEQIKAAQQRDANGGGFRGGRDGGRSGRGGRGGFRGRGGRGRSPRGGGRGGRGRGQKRGSEGGATQGAYKLVKND